MIKTLKKLHSGQLLYFRRQPQWVGFGDLPNEQPDLFIEEVRFAWWHVGICRTCLLAERQRMSDEIARINELVRIAKVNVGQAIGLVEKKAGQG